MNRECRKWVQRVAACCFWLLVWQLCTWCVDNSLLLAGPLETAEALGRGLLTGHFYKSVATSVLSILTGFLAALALGGLLAVAAYRSGLVRQLLSPAMSFCKAVPVAAFSVILLIWLGAEGLSAAISFLVALPIIYVNFCEGLSRVDQKLLELARVFEMPLYNRVFYLYRPALVPFVESSLRTGLGMGIKAGVAAEVIGMVQQSIGGGLYEAKIYLETAQLFAWTIVVIVLNGCLEKGVLLLWRSFCDWKPHPLTVRRQRDAVQPAGTVLLLEKLGKAYGEKQVLSHVFKRLEAGERYCLMAPSGSGKTTLLRLLAGLEKPDEGRVDRGTEYAAGGGMVFQEDRLLETETALCNVELTCGSRQEAEACLKALLPEKELASPVSALSGGMRRRVCLARALASPSALLLLDEPFTGLDEESRRNAAAVLEKWRRGRTVVVATHEAGDAVLLSAEIWRLQREKS